MKKFFAAAAAGLLSNGVCGLRMYETVATDSSAGDKQPKNPPPPKPLTSENVSVYNHNQAAATASTSVYHTVLAKTFNKMVPPAVTEFASTPMGMAVMFLLALLLLMGISYLFLYFTKEKLEFEALKTKELITFGCWTDAPASTSK